LESELLSETKTVAGRNAARVLQQSMLGRNDPSMFVRSHEDAA